jgi:hypothetical protein
LWAYRAVIAALLATLVVGGALAWQRRQRQAADPYHTLAPADADVWAVDGGAVYEAIRDTKASFSDRSVPFWGSPRATVHMHLIGRGQICPLHLHPGPDEVTVIVGGEADTTHVFGVDGKAVTRTGRRAPGTVVRSPPFCGHEWAPADPDVVQGNLVFASPSFSGNYFTKPDDPRLLEGAEPFIYQPDEDLAALAQAPEPRRVKEVPGMGGGMSVLLVKGASTIEASPAGPVVGYVLRGKGALDDGDRVPLHERMFIVLRGKKASVPVRAEPGSPLAILRYETTPPRAAPRDATD